MYRKISFMTFQQSFVSTSMTITNLAMLGKKRHCCTIKFLLSALGY